MNTKREWIQAILAGEKGLPVAQHWMSFFNGDVARRLTPEDCHYENMWLYEVPDTFDFSAMTPAALDGMIRFNNHTGRCFACLGKGHNLAFGHGAPGEFHKRLVRRDASELVAEYETGVHATVQFHPHFYHHDRHPVRTQADWERIVLPDAADPARYEGFAHDAAYLRKRSEYVVGALNGFFSSIHYFLMDYAEVFRALLMEPDLIRSILERLGEWNLTAACRMIQAGADCIGLCDDLGSKNNLLMAPGLYRDFFKSWHRRLCEEVHAAGGTVHLHSHGAIGPLLGDLVECGFDFINPFDPEEGWDLEAVLKDEANKFVVVGGFATKFWEWDAATQAAYLEKMAKLGHKYGRLIFMDSGGVPENVTRENFDRISSVSRRVRGVEDVPWAV